MNEVKHMANERDRRKRSVLVIKTAGITQLSTEVIDNSVAGAERETLVGIKGNVGIAVVDATPGDLRLALVRVPKGEAAGQLGTTDGGELYPHLEHLLWGLVLPVIAQIGQAFLVMLDVKTKRKLRVGDKVLMLVRSTTDNGWDIMANLNVFTLE